MTNSDDIVNKINNTNNYDSFNSYNGVNDVKSNPDSLLDIAARIVAETEPFQRVEERLNDRIPEPVQRRIIFWSFPRNERDICMYSSLSRASSFNASDSQTLSFCKGLKLLENNCVENVLQVGFHLSGIVWTYPPQNDPAKLKLNNQGNANNSNSGSSLLLLSSFPSQNNLNLIPQNNGDNNRSSNNSNNNSDNNNGNSVQYSGEENKKYKVSVSFDRCKITSVTCSCDTKDIFWCHHVVALTLYRIRNADKIKLRVPISETLLQMNRQQLQKFVQYLIAEHHTEVLPTAQRLADEILHHRSEINAICGAPDPTAGASKEDENSWHLDEMQVCEAVRSYLGQGSYYNSNKQLNCLFGKVREMLRAQDSNGARMLTLITEQFLNDPRLVLWKSHGTPMTEKCRQLWDQLGSLWVCVVLNPKSTQIERNHWKELLEKWSKIDVCPQEDPDFRPPGRESHRLRSQREREYERNRFFRENNARNAMYHQYQQQQAQQANNNYNQHYFNDNNGNNNRNNYLNPNNNYDNSLSSSSSSSSDDSESESDEEMDDNNDANPIENENVGVIANEHDLIVNNVNNLFENERAENQEDNDHLIQRINNFIEEEDNAVMNDLSIDDSNRQAPREASEDDCFKFNLPALHRNVDNDDSSRESMDEDNIRDEHELLENINNLENGKIFQDECEKDDEKNMDLDDEFESSDRKEILKIDNINFLEQLDNQKNIENPENVANENIENQPNAEDNSNVEFEQPNNRNQNDQKKIKKTHRPRDLFYDQLKPNKKMKLNNGNSVGKNGQSVNNKHPRTIFHKALDAVNMTWDNEHLKNILASDSYSIVSQNSVQIAGSSKSAMSNNTSAKSNFNILGQPLWHEPMSMCASRIDSLRSHGHIDAALRLSVSVVRTMKQLQRDAQMLWQKYKPIPPQPTKYAASASVNDCNNSKCKDCQLNKLFEFTIHKSSYSTISSTPPSSSTPITSSSSSISVSSSAISHPSSSVTSTSSSNIMSTHKDNDCQKCNEIDERKRTNQMETDNDEKSSTNSIACQSQNYQPYPSSSSIMPPPPPPPKIPPPPKYEMPQAGCSKDIDKYGMKNKYMTQCMCHYHNQLQPPSHHQQPPSGHHSSSSMHSYPIKNNCPVPCSFRHAPPPPAPHQMNRMGPMPGPSAGPSGPSSSHMYPTSSKYYETPKNISGPPPQSSNAQPMQNICQMHQKRPCIKSMCCSMMPPIHEKHHQPNYCNRGPHCNSSHCSSSPHLGASPNAPGPSNYMTKYQNQNPTGPQQSSFCNSCMRSNCLLKTNSPLPPPPPQPMMQMPPPANPVQSNLCKNCKSLEMKPSLGHIPLNSFRAPPPPPSGVVMQGAPLDNSIKPVPSTSSNNSATAEPSKYNIVNYGASTSKINFSVSNNIASSSTLNVAAGSSSTSSSSSSTSNNSAAGSSSATNQNTSTFTLDVKFQKKNPNCVSQCLDCSLGCEIEFPLDAVACIFDCLTEACISTSDVSNICSLSGRLNSLNSVEDSNIIAPKYKHIQVPGSKDSTETFLTLAFEAAILALGKQRIMPSGLYAQHLICKQQDQLIARLRNVDLDQLLVEVIKKLSIQMMDGGPTSGFGESIHPESVPMHTLARFLFASLLNQYPDLAFKIGLRAMRFPILENARNENQESSSGNANYVNSPYPRWWTLGHLESQQCSLSSTMLSASKGDKVRLASVLENARQNIHSSTHLFKLAQDAFRFATPENGPRSQTLLSVAFELGLQVMRMTLTCLNWRRREMVRWLVTCATQLGLDATISIMQNWYELFTPTEATGPVATTIMSHSTILRLNLNIKQQENLSSCARTLALQCATKDPPNCALNALTLCENDPMAFEAAYHIVIDAANHIMTSSQLFTIARYMEHRGFPVRAYNLAILAMKNVHLAYNQDTHPAINDIHWACALSHSLGKAELSKMIPLVVKNVQCATVLSDILRRCSVPNPGMSHFNNHHRGNSMRSCGKLSYDREPLNQLLEAAVAAYVNTTHSRLSHISPRHYGDFIDFLSKARDTFVLARDGPAHFSRLIENITIAYKGKKKLVRQVRQRFQFV